MRYASSDSCSAKSISSFRFRKYDLSTLHDRVHFELMNACLSAKKVEVTAFTYASQPVLRKTPNHSIGLQTGDAFERSHRKDSRTHQSTNSRIIIIIDPEIYTRPKVDQELPLQCSQKERICKHISFVLLKPQTLVFVFGHIETSLIHWLFAVLSGKGEGMLSQV